ncbi:MAG: hypothetical protein CM1200mP34_4750 [Verrucomicrobiales bacterium]|nr:MAG: hypothetical protein CM1200mP34_4750 [Verrucomicrobiales bacterium]
MARLGQYNRYRAWPSAAKYSRAPAITLGESSRVESMVGTAIMPNMMSRKLIKSSSLTIAETMIPHEIKQDHRDARAWPEQEHPHLVT